MRSESILSQAVRKELFAEGLAPSQMAKPPASAMAEMSRAPFRTRTITISLRRGRDYTAYF